MTSSKARGRGSLVFRDELQLRRVHQLQMWLSAGSANGQPIRVTVTEGRGWNARKIGSFLVSTPRHVTIRLPAGARRLVDSLSINVTAARIVAAGHRVTLGVGQVGAVV
jgi:hypothetical protein